MQQLLDLPPKKPFKFLELKNYLGILENINNL
jgi:hypothetical protein